MHFPARSEPILPEHPAGVAVDANSMEHADKQQSVFYLFEELEIEIGIPAGKHDFKGIGLAGLAGIEEDLRNFRLPALLQNAVLRILQV
ncbi:MAG: hypothetical protein NTZ12_09450 [Candidatus Aminicenantes bacterium]|nr:hypothetical protein [Candidatus Aminicenantes bacterium]